MDLEARGGSHKPPGDEGYIDEQTLEDSSRTTSRPFLRLTDSLVCLRDLTRDRSSGRKLRSTTFWGYIHTSQNPADRPCRRPQRRKMGKLKRG